MTCHRPSSPSPPHVLLFPSAVTPSCPQLFLFLLLLLLLLFPLPLLLLFSFFSCSHLHFFSSISSSPSPHLFSLPFTSSYLSLPLTFFHLTCSSSALSLPYCIFLSFFPLPDFSQLPPLPFISLYSYFYLNTLTFPSLFFFLYFPSPFFFLYLHTHVNYPSPYTSLLFLLTCINNHFPSFPIP